MAESIVVRHVLAPEVSQYRELRLAALAESPAAFTATWEDERAMPEAEWVARVDADVQGTGAILVADTGDELVGLAVGIPWGDRARVMSVWVAPRWRRRGLAERLIEMVCDWARDAGYPEAQIETAIGNAPAQRVYERLGFLAVDEESLPDCGPVLVRALQVA